MRKDWRYVHVRTRHILGTSLVKCHSWILQLKRCFFSQKTFEKGRKAFKSIFSFSTTFSTLQSIFTLLAIFTLSCLRLLWIKTTLKSRRLVNSQKCRLYRHNLFKAMEVTGQLTLSNTILGC